MKIKKQLNRKKSIITGNAEEYALYRAVQNLSIDGLDAAIAKRTSSWGSNVNFIKKKRLTDDDLFSTSETPADWFVTYYLLKTGIANYGNDSSNNYILSIIDASRALNEDDVSMNSPIGNLIKMSLLAEYGDFRLKTSTDQLGPKVVKAGIVHTYDEFKRKVKAYRYAPVYFKTVGLIAMAKELNVMRYFKEDPESQRIVDALKGVETFGKYLNFQDFDTLRSRISSRNLTAGVDLKKLELFEANHLPVIKKHLDDITVEDDCNYHSLNYTFYKRYPTRNNEDGIIMEPLPDVVFSYMYDSLASDEVILCDIDEFDESFKRIVPNKDSNLASSLSQDRLKLLTEAASNHENVVMSLQDAIYQGRVQLPKGRVIGTNNTELLQRSIINKMDDFELGPDNKCRVIFTTDMPLDMKNRKSLRMISKNDGEYTYSIPFEDISKLQEYYMPEQIFVQGSVKERYNMKIDDYLYFFGEVPRTNLSLPAADKENIAHIIRAFDAVDNGNFKTELKTSHMGHLAQDYFMEGTSIDDLNADRLKPSKLLVLGIASMLNLVGDVDGKTVILTHRHSDTMSKMFVDVLKNMNAIERGLANPGKAINVFGVDMIFEESAGDLLRKDLDNFFMHLITTPYNIVDKEYIVPASVVGDYHRLVNGDYVNKINSLAKLFWYLQTMIPLDITPNISTNFKTKFLRTIKWK